MQEASFDRAERKRAKNGGAVAAIGQVWILLELTGVFLSLGWIWSNPIRHPAAGKTKGRLS